MEDLGLDVRVCAEDVEEPGERGDDEVLGREHVTDGRVAEEMVPLPFGHAGVPRPRHVQGQEVAAASSPSGGGVEGLGLAVGDLAVDELVEDRLCLGEPPLGADVEPPHHPPPPGRHDVPEQRSLAGHPGRLADQRDRRRRTACPGRRRRRRRRTRRASTA